MLSPFVEFNRHLAEVDRLLLRTGQARKLAPSRPRITVTETKDAWLLEGLLPGWSADDLQIEVEGGVLTLRGAVEVSTPEGLSVLQRERRDRSFSHTLRLPEGVDEDAITARTKDGVLTVTLPRQPRTPARRITVEAA